MDSGRFDSIRPWNDREYPAALDRLLSDREFIRVIDDAIGWLRRKIAFHQARRCHNCDELQKRLICKIIKKHIDSVGSTLTFDFGNIQPKGNSYLFISNHRDIVMDSTLLDYGMISFGAKGTGIAIGDNLLIHDWIETLVRINKSFIVRRGEQTPAEFLESSTILSEYIHQTIENNTDSIWIAQREGRSKDSNDLTQRALVKMLSMAGGTRPVESLSKLHIVPLAISYEYDPCDWLKAMEFQQKRDNPNYHKTRENDLLNMKTGIFGYKGRIHYQAAQCIDIQIVNIDSNRPRNIQLDTASGLIDREIHLNYRIYPVNHIALDLLEHDTTQSQFYTEADKTEFLKYKDRQLSKIDLPVPDWDFLSMKFLEMYANPLRNQLIAQGNR